jgi:hypothetical protein
MDIYRITENDPRRHHYWQGPKKTRYGTKRSATAVAKSVRETNDARVRGGAFMGKDPQLMELTIERAPVGEFTDVTAEFLGEGE